MGWIRSIILMLCCLTAVCAVNGCRSVPSGDPDPPSGADETEPLFVPQDQILVFFLRQVNFAGGGRTHVLGVDGKPIGNLTGDNYFRLEMWPGEYEFSVSLPREAFLGQVTPATNFSRQIALMPHPAGNAYVCSYTDGMGTSGFSLEPIDAFPKMLAGRLMSMSLTARQTAQVTHLFTARYDGPAVGRRPHGRGTLTWPDGSVYRGIFMHGDPTRNGRFIFPDGRIYMGPNYRGRPAGKGLLMSPQGDILFAGRIANERPDGTGLRVGQDGPEFCRFDAGRDITKTFRQLAAEALDAEDRAQIADYSRRADAIDARIQVLQARLDRLGTSHDPDRVAKSMEAGRRSVSALEEQKRQIEKDGAAQMESFVRQLERSRHARELERAEVIRKRHEKAIEKERAWCLDELGQEKNLCVCAPFADDFDQWDECWEPLRQRYVY